MENGIKVYVINGPNLNLLGTREPEIYGTETLASIAKRCQARGAKTGLDIEFRQSNHEGEIVDWIHEAIRTEVAAIVINAGAYTHTSIAILDALKAYNGYKIELHISSPHMRESFRHLSYVSLAADKIVTGLGVKGYEHCVDLLSDLLSADNAK